MKVKFTATTQSNLFTVPIIDGQIIAIMDQPGYYYDFGGTRYKVNNVSITPTLSAGTKIGEIIINGTTTDMYAPTPPSAISQLTNDIGYITNAVNDLANYYLKSETYTKEEVNTLISSIPTMDIRVVNSLPTENISTTTIYLVPSSDPEQQNVKDEYINTTGTSAGWEKIGSTAVDLSDYPTWSDMYSVLEDYVEDYELSDYVSNSDLSETLENYVETDELDEFQYTVEQDYLLKCNSDQYSDSIQIDTSSSMRINSDSSMEVTSDDSISLNASTATIYSGYDTGVTIIDGAINVNASTATIGEAQALSSLDVNASTVTFGQSQSVDVVTVNASTFSAGTGYSGYPEMQLTDSSFDVSISGRGRVSLGSTGASVVGNGKVVIEQGSCSGAVITLGTVPNKQGVIIDSGEYKNIYLDTSEHIYISNDNISGIDLFDLLPTISAFCPTESGSTTTRAYVKGDIFSSGGTVYQATDDIPYGTYISYASTQEVTNLGEAIRFAVQSVIDDVTPSTDTTYSSSKIDELIADIPSGGRSITNSTAAPHTSSNIQTTVTVTKEE